MVIFFEGGGCRVKEGRVSVWDRRGRGRGGSSEIILLLVGCNFFVGLGYLKGILWHLLMV